MTIIIGASLGLIAAGPIGALGGAGAAHMLTRLRRRPVGPPGLRLVSMLMLVELRSGMSVLAALQSVSQALPDHQPLHRVARVATVLGLTAAIPHADPSIRPLIAQLARAQRSGGPLSGTVRRILEQDLARERAERLNRVRSLPVRLVLPVTLLMLPGMVLFLYAPSLLQLFDELTGVLP